MNRPSALADLRCLERGVQEHTYANLYLRHARPFDPLRDDPRFQAILEGMGLAD